MERLKKIIQRFNKARVLVVGDLILDEYIWGKVDRISPEAPVPVVWANRRTNVPGGAANVANNITALDGKVCLVGVVGRDKNSEILLSELRKRKIDSNGVFIESSRHTTLKTRIIAGHQQVVRVDWENTEPLSRAINKKIFTFIEKNIKNFDAVIIEDYGKGVINKDLLDGIVSLVDSQKKVVTVDPKEEHFQLYRGVTSITPNRKELENAVRNLKLTDTTNRFKMNNDRLFSDRDIDIAARQVLEYLELDSILVTLGEQGMRLFEKQGRITHIPTVAQEVFDVSGAGDTVIGTFSLALSCGADKLDAAYIANYASGIVVGKVGTATTSRKELIERINR
ncbi:MAG: D-glycero-beta-D-manno-heptose-7-phosphate kinase [Candidatus Omnitrophica bacterium]|nr:D-glycero-beta-D-manno-heptose-7-phosphate kinase [Candidatus Omnitrophota bacterium]MBU1869991.1 D-glycero-beta-D-manno-heptose-7-phosphate kinase [Candidatus Omnitrophota bacterium]